MPKLEELQSALIKADQAGNTEDAKRLADAIRNQVSEQSPMDLTRGVVKAGVEDFIGGVKSFGEDPVGTTAKAGVDIYETAKSFGNALLNESPEIASGIGGELASKPFKFVPKIAGEIAGVTGAKIIDKNKPFSQALSEATKEALIGRALVGAGDRVRRMKLTQGVMSSVFPNKVLKPAKERLEDNILTRESLLGGVTDVRDASVKQIGERMPVVVETGGKASRKHLNTLAKAVQESSIKDASDSYLYKMVDDVEKNLQSSLSKNNTSSIGLAGDFKDALSKYVRKGVDTRTRAFKEATNIAVKSNEKLKTRGVLTQIDELLSPQAELNTNAALKVKKAIDSVIRDDKGLLKSSLSLKEYAKLKQTLSDVAGNFSKAKDVQTQIQGITGAIKEDILKPFETGIIKLGQLGKGAGKDTLAYMQIMDNIRGISDDLGEVVNTKVTGQIGASQTKQLVKNVLESKTLDNMFSDPQSYTVAEKVLGNINPELVNKLESGLRRQVLRKIYKDGLTSKSIRKVIGEAGNPTGVGEILIQRDPEIIKGLENTALISEALEKFKKEVVIPKLQEDTLKKDLGQSIFTGSTGFLTGHSLREKSGVAQTIGHIVKASSRLLRGDLGAYTDRDVVKMLSNESGEKIYKKALATTVYDPEAYDVFRRTVTALGVRPMSSEEFKVVLDNNPNLPEDTTISDIVTVGAKDPKTIERASSFIPEQNLKVK